MTEFEIKNLENYYKIVDNNLLDMITSDVIYTIENPKTVRGYIFLCINDVPYFMIHYYNNRHDICTRVTINLTTRQVYIKNDATLYLQKPIRTDKDGNIIFRARWVLDDFIGIYRVKFNSDCNIEVLGGCSDSDDQELDSDEQE